MSDGDKAAPENETTGAKRDKDKRKKIRALGRWLISTEKLPHYLIALFTFGLLLFAIMAWREAQQGTVALQGQLLTMQAVQRPLMWVTGLTPAPIYHDDTGQVSWNWNYQNIGKSIAFGVTVRTYIKAGIERFQRGHSMGVVQLN